MVGSQLSRSLFLRKAQTSEGSRGESESQFDNFAMIGKAATFELGVRARSRRRLDVNFPSVVIPVEDEINSFCFFFAIFQSPNHDKNVWQIQIAHFWLTWVGHKILCLVWRFGSSTTSGEYLSLPSPAPLKTGSRKHGGWERRQTERRLRGEDKSPSARPAARVKVFLGAWHAKRTDEPGGKFDSS